VNWVPSSRGFLSAAFSVLLLWLGLQLNSWSWPLLTVAWVPLLIYVTSAPRRQALVCTLLTGLGHFVLQLYWIVFVLGHYGGLPLFVSIPALLLLSLYMTSYLLVFVLLTQLFVTRFSAHASLWLLPAAWVGMEYLRSLVLTGFPWMDMGYGVASVPLLYQSADIWGHAGISYLLLLVNSFFLLSSRAAWQRKSVLPLALPLVLVCGVAISYSPWRWRQVEASFAGQEVLNIAVVQGNVEQKQKWQLARARSTVSGYVQQSLQLMDDDHGLRPDLLVWPETALPFFPINNPLQIPVEELVRDNNVQLLSGAPWYTKSGPGPKDIRYYNSALLFDSSGSIVARSSKNHLVPFGEYVPLKKFLPFIAPLVEAVGDFSRGEIRDALPVKSARLGVLICFESIFPGLSRKWVDAGANVLVNITNDAWYGNSIAPYQTLAMTRLRAVETRRSVVRSANTGFSGFIDPLGRITEQSPLFVSYGATRPVILMQERTLFVRWGYLFAPGCLLLVAALWLWLILRSVAVKP
jgi:apolipoprotein N-acyltransferase